MVKYENLNVAICSILEKFPARFEHFRKTCEERFLEDFAEHLKAADSFKEQKADTAPVYHFITEYRPTELKQRLGALRQKLSGIPVALEEPKKAEKKAEKKTEKKVEKKAPAKATAKKATAKKATTKAKKEPEEEPPAKGKKRAAAAKSAGPKKKAKQMK